MIAFLITTTGSWLLIGARYTLAQQAVDPAPAAQAQFAWVAVIVALVLTLAVAVASFVSSKRTHRD